MELGIKKKGLLRRLPAIAGFLSFAIALLALAGLNVGQLIKQGVFFGIFIYQLPLLGLFLGIVGLFSKKPNRFFAIWGLSLCIFIFIFIFLMIGLSWMAINPKP